MSANETPDTRQIASSNQFLLSRMAHHILSTMQIGARLTLGFGILVLLILLIISLSFISSRVVSNNLDTIGSVRAPLALSASQAQADLLRMLADVRGYLALGDEEYRISFSTGRDAFEENLNTLEMLINSAPVDTSTLEFDNQLIDLTNTYTNWAVLPERLFDLRDDQLEREPALRILIEEGNPYIASILSNTSQLISAQEQREPDQVNMSTLGDMADFQSSFFAIVAGLRGYVATGRSSFKFEYQSNVLINDEAWENLLAIRDDLTDDQQILMDEINTDITVFFTLPEQMFDAVESERAREDLYLFRTEAVPLAETMSAILGEMTLDQQLLLQTELIAGQRQLNTVQLWNLLIGLIALMLALGLVYLIRESIVIPIKSLTGVADEIAAGNLSAQANITTSDEIGTLGTTFNSMTRQLRNTLDDLETRRREQVIIAEKLQQQNAYLSTLHQLTLGLMSRLDLDELLDVLMIRVGSLLTAPHGFVYLIDPTKKNVLELRIGQGIFRNMIGSRIRIGEGLAGRVWQDGAPLLIEEYEKWEGRLDDTNYDQLGIAVAFPLLHTSDTSVSKSKAIGVIGLAYDTLTERPFGDEEMELLARFSDLASVAIDNARLYQSAREARTAAELANTAKSNFLANMSHELRTPLNSIIGFTKIVRRKGKDVLPEKQLGNLEKVLVSSEHLLSLINTILDLAKIEARRVDVYASEFSIKNLIEMCLGIVNAMVKPGVVLTSDVQDAGLILNSDQDKIKQILLNLLSNAAKFTEQGSITVVPVVDEHGMIHIDVRDTGMGISEKALSTIFDEFSQDSEQGILENKKGTGLGLTISRELARLLGGDLTVRSAWGQGTTFTLSIPVHYADAETK